MRELIYILDTYCGWCYGFSPTVRELAADPDVKLTVRHGALFTENRSAPIGQYSYIPAANARISALTGIEFRAGYEAMLAEGSTVMNSNDAAARAATEQRQVLGLGVDHYPTLLAVAENGLVEVGSPTASAAEIKPAL